MASHAESEDHPESQDSLQYRSSAAKETSALSDKPAGALSEVCSKFPIKFLLAAAAAKTSRTIRTEINRKKMGSTILSLLDWLEVIIDMMSISFDSDSIQPILSNNT